MHESRQRRCAHFRNEIRGKQSRVIAQLQRNFMNQLQFSAFRNAMREEKNIIMYFSIHGKNNVKPGNVTSTYKNSDDSKRNSYVYRYSLLDL